jgi:VIT1/CCC1 family predicted Fe2+/Mn2+ transporter
MSRLHSEIHLVHRSGWLRAAVLGANDGIVSTASLIIGVAAAEVAQGDVLIAGFAALVAGAMSMAAGEYVSVSSQSDTERADLERERAELADDPHAELQELAAIYRTRGLDAPTALVVAEQLMAKDALGAHARDELGISETIKVSPIQAALASGASFTAGASLPLITVLLSPASLILQVVSIASLVFLAALGVISAAVGRANMLRATARVLFWGALAMAATAAIGAMVGTVF